MPFICPVCNNFHNVKTTCSICQNQMRESGRLMDFFGDYSPYLEIDGVKKADGIPNDLAAHQCPHIYTCLHCGTHTQILINEIFVP